MQISQKSLYFGSMNSKGSEVADGTEGFDDVAFLGTKFLASPGGESRFDWDAEVQKYLAASKVSL